MTKHQKKAKVIKGIATFMGGKILAVSVSQPKKYKGDMYFQKVEIHYTPLNRKTK